MPIPKRSALTERSTSTLPHLRNALATLFLLLVIAWMIGLAPEVHAQAAAATPPAQPELLDLPEDTNVAKRLDFAFTNATDKLMRLVSAAPLLLVAILIVMLFSWLGGFISRRLHWLRLRTDNPYLDGMLRGAVKIVIVLSGVVIALDMLEATPLVSAVLGSAGVVGLVMGFAFKDIAENYIAGILLSLRRPFAPGEHVKIDGNEGRVVALSSRATQLMTLEGNELRLPNALVFKAIILNYSRNPKRRFDFTITIDGAQSIHASQELAMDRIASIDGVLDDPRPSWTVVEYTPAGITLRFFGWVNQRESDLGKVRSECIRQVKAAFSKAGIESPRTVYHVINGNEPEAAAPGPTGSGTGTSVSAATNEPSHGVAADTSVNTDIDEQLAQAQQSSDFQNLLEPHQPAPQKDPA